ncbi:hypothetical protein BT63DRAFT_424106 [Microthyrium microscopicum]|uniref:Uncharacterized protein n=1 Tax=Microthyrium microscopicum TaxID=703497 RepID=A0A6A6UDB4_9PEZI|nr:hypothetical protein BT63DRAFT_424106 [Microthyrium microscopicum]
MSPSIEAVIMLFIALPIGLSMAHKPFPGETRFATISAPALLTYHMYGSPGIQQVGLSLGPTSIVEQVALIDNLCHNRWFDVVPSDVDDWS